VVQYAFYDVSKYNSNTLSIIDSQQSLNVAGEYVKKDLSIILAKTYSIPNQDKDDLP